MPSVFLMAFWIGLWLFWPQKPAGSKLTRALPEPRVEFRSLKMHDVSLYMNPTLFGPPSEIGVKIEEPADGAPDIALNDRKERSAPIGRADAPVRSCLDVPDPLSTIARREMGSHRLLDQRPPAFRSGGDLSMELSYDVDEALRGCGFEIPSLKLEGLAPSNMPWMVTVKIDVGPDGIPVHVLMETGSDYPAVNAAIVRGLYGGKAARPGMARRGRVTINYGTR